jgi:hypothetical protein
MHARLHAGFSLYIDSHRFRQNTSISSPHRELFFRIFIGKNQNLASADVPQCPALSSTVHANSMGKNMGRIIWDATSESSPPNSSRT